MTETLRQKQSRFAMSVALLIQRADALGLDVTFGEAWRTPEQAKLNAANGTGTFTSLHIERLAIDINLFRDGVWLKGTEDHRPLGEWWEKLGQDYRWGGRFTRPDGNHYAISPDGKRA
jgi:hypothetical protein